MKDTIKQRIAQVRRREVPEEYITKHGYCFPIAWHTEKLRDAFSRLTTKNTEKCENVLTISAQQGLISQRDYYIHSYASENTQGYSLLKKGDYAYNKSYSDGYPFGAIKRLDKYDQGIVSPLYICFSPNIGTNSDYYNHYFGAGVFNREIYSIAQEGARNHGLLNVAVDDFFDGYILCPPIAEQQKIAKILSQCDKVISLKQELLEEKRKQKKWLMQRLLTGKTRLNGYTGKWKSANMQKLFLFGGALAASREQLGNEGLCYLHYGDIHANDTFEIDVKRDYGKIPKLQYDKVQDRYLLKDGDVAFVDASEDYLGASKYVVIKNPDNIPFISGLHTMPIREKGDELLTEYKRYCFQSGPFVRQVAFYVSGMKILGVSKDNLGKIVLKYPLKDEQTAIANILSTADKGIDLLEQELAAWKEKKKGLAQLLLTGLVRV